MEQKQQNGKTEAYGSDQLVLNPPLLLKNFRQSDLRDFLESGDIEKYRVGDYIIRVGDPGNNACLIVNGIASIWKDNIHMASLKRGDFIGEMFLFNQSKRLSNILAEEDTTVIRFLRERILDFFRAKPQRLFNVFIMNVINLQHQKILAMDKKIVSLQKHLMKMNEEQSS